MVCGSGDESAVLSDHAEEALELLDGSRRLEGPDRVDAVWKRGDAVFVEVISEEFQRGFPEDALLPVCREPVCP